MNRPRWQKIFADVWGNRTRSILVVASIAVGLFAIGVISTIYLVVAQDMRSGYASINAANLYIQADGITQDMVAHLNHVDGVRQVEGVRAFDLRVWNKKGDWQSISLEARLDPAQTQINRVIPLSGQWPPADNEIVVDQSKLSDLGLSIGDALTLELPSGKTRTLKLVGVVQDLTIGAFSGGGGFFHAPVQGYITQGTLDKLEQSDSSLYNGLYVTITGDGADVSRANDVSTRLNQELKNTGVDVRSSTARSSYDHPNGYLVDAIVGVLFVLGLLVVFLSGFLITNTLQSLVNQQVQQIGIMKTLGARRYQIAIVYMLLILIFGLVAFFIAMPLANSVSFLLLSFLGSQLNFILMGDRLVMPVVALQAVLALVMPQVAAWAPIWQGTRISVQEALSGIQQGGEASEDAPERRGWLARWSRSHSISRPMLISIRNTFRRKGRLALTLTTLTLGGAIFIATFNVQVSMSKYMDQIARYFLADVNVSLDRPYRVDEITQVLSQVPGVGRIEAWAAARSEMIQPDGSSGEQVQLLAPPPDSQLIQPKMLKGRWIRPGDSNAIVLNELFLSSYPQIHLGDMLDLHVNDKDTAWVVVGFFQFAGKNGGLSAYTSYDTLSTMIGQVNQAVTYRIVSSQPNLTSQGQASLSQAIQKELESRNIQISNLETGSFLTGVAGGGFATLTAFLLFLAVLTALVGSIGLAGTMSMNVLERTREIGVMRAIGASDQTLMKMVLVEGMVIGALSYILGALLAFPISKIMADGISLSIFDAPSNLGFTPIGFIIWLVVVVVLSFLASVMPARSAARLTIREVLAYE